MIDSVSVDLPDDDQQLNETKRTLQYGVDLSLYPLDTTLSFMVRKEKISEDFFVCCYSVNIFKNAVLD